MLVSRPMCSSTGLVVRAMTGGWRAWLDESPVLGPRWPRPDDVGSWLPKGGGDAGGGGRHSGLLWGF